MAGHPIDRVTHQEDHQRLRRADGSQGGGPALKEQEPLPFTALDAAKDFIRPYVIRGDTIDQLAQGQMGTSRPEYAAQIGGVAHEPGPSPMDPGRHWVVGTHRIAVTRLGGRRMFARFKIEDVYQLVHTEDVKGERQGRLF